MKSFLVFILLFLLSLNFILAASSQFEVDFNVVSSKVIGEQKELSYDFVNNWIGYVAILLIVLLLIKFIFMKRKRVVVKKVKRNENRRKKK